MGLDSDLSCATVGVVIVTLGVAAPLAIAVIAVIAIGGSRALGVRGAMAFSTAE